MIDAILDNLRTYWPVHLLLLAYTGVLAYHAWSGNRSTRSIADYFVGGRAMGPLTIGLSFFATYSSTNSFVGFSGRAYEWGVTWFVLVPFVVGLCLFAWVAVAPRLRTFTESLGSLTIPDFIGFRFGSPTARVAAAVIIIFASLLYMTAVFQGIGYLLESFLEIPYHAAIAVVFVVVMAYTAVGGFISVVKTDAVQGLVMVAAGILLFWGTAKAAGGIGALAELAGDPTTAPLLRWGGGVEAAGSAAAGSAAAGDAAAGGGTGTGGAVGEIGAGVVVPLAIGVAFANTLKFAVEPRQLSRFYALESRAAARKSLWVSTLAFLVVYSLLIPVGLYARAVVPGLADTDLVVPTLLTAEGVFSEGVGAFLLLAMVAAAMSSLDSVLLVMASTAQRDVAGFFRKAGTDRSVLSSTRIYVGLFALITALIALDPPTDIVSLTAFSGAVYGACFGPSLILGLHWRRGNGAASLASFVVGLAVLLTWNRMPWTGGVHQVFPGVVFSFLAYWAVARATAAYQSTTVDRLFEGEQTRASGGGR